MLRQRGMAVPVVLAWCLHFPASMSRFGTCSQNASVLGRNRTWSCEIYRWMNTSVLQVDWMIECSRHPIQVISLVLVIYDHMSFLVKSLLHIIATFPLLENIFGPRNRAKTQRVRWRNMAAVGRYQWRMSFSFPTMHCLSGRWKHFIIFYQ